MPILVCVKEALQPPPRRAARSAGRPRTLGSWRLWGFPAILLALLAAEMLLGLLVGGRANSFAGSWDRIPTALTFAFAPDRLPDAAQDDLVSVIALLRLPRTLLAALAGVALGAAGTVIQGHTRNPLADPGILGINAGAAAAIVLGLSTGLITGGVDYLWPALIGAGLVSLLVFLLSSSRSAVAHPLSIVLAGAGLSALLMAYVQAMVLSDDDILNHMRNWATGSVDGRDPGTAGFVLPIILVGLVLGAAQTRALNILALGEQTARSMGIPVGLHRGLGVATVALLGGAATAGAGPVSFIGLAAPHMVRAVVGQDHRLVLPCSALIGGLLALTADILGRVVARPGEVQMGVMMALIGAPFLVLLVRRGGVGSL